MPLDDEEIERGIESLPSAEPPSDLRDSIMSYVRANGGVTAAAPAVGRPRRFTFALGWAAAAGIVLVFVLIARPQLSNSDSAATMAPLMTTFETPEVNVAVRRDGDLIHVQPVLQSEGPLTITVRWNSESAALAGISGAPDASSQNNQTTFLLQGAGARAAVSLGVHPAARSTEVRVLADGEEIVRTNVSLE